MKQDATASRCGHLRAVRELAVRAGERILEIYEQDFDVVAKADGSPLTQADQAAHRVIVEDLSRLTPDIPILSEESVTVAYAERAAWTRFWLVDPLDGTKEFVNRNGEFTVNIALIDAGRPVLGVVHVPVSGVTYSACDGAGAFRQSAGESPQTIRVADYAGGRARVVASRSHAGAELEHFLAQLAAREGDYATVAMGSSLKLCLVADGSADVYPRLGPTSEWDTAAAQCVVEVAGGRVVDMKNRPLVYNKESILNPWFMACGGGDYNWTTLVPFMPVAP